MAKYEQKECAYCGTKYLLKETDGNSIYSDWCGNCTIDSIDEKRYVPEIDCLLVNFKL